MSVRTLAALAAVSLFALPMHHACAGRWTNLVADSFDGSTTGLWTYAGVTNSAGEPLFRYDPTGGVIRAEWDQSNYLDVVPDPMVIGNSYISRPLAAPLDDSATFRVRVVIQLDPGSVVDTREFFGIANFCLFNPGTYGPDRAMSDNWSGNSTLIRDSSDLVEWNYWINTNYGGRSIGAVIAAHIDEFDGLYTTGSDYAQTTMGGSQALPSGIPLHAELAYYGAESGPLARTCHARICTDATYAETLSITNADSGLPKRLSYWTTPLAQDQHFTVTHAGFFNHVQASFTGENGFGRGAFDNLLVQSYDPQGDITSARSVPGGIEMRWIAASGATYYVQGCTNLVQPRWTTQDVVTASGPEVVWTNLSPGAPQQFFKVTAP